MGNYSATVQAIHDRLQAQNAPGKLLADVKRIQFIPVKEVTGTLDTPTILFFLPTISETWRPRAVGLNRLKVRFEVYVPRKNGAVALISLIEKILDSIETTPDGAVDATLNGTLRRPFDVVDDGAFVNDVTITAQITLLMVPKKLVLRGKRSI